MTASCIADGRAPIGIATCYEVVFDRAFETSVRAGAQLLAVPTNNATFGDTEMTYQQLAMSRVRAVEHAPAVVVAATSGVSAIIGPDGDGDPTHAQVCATGVGGAGSVAARYYAGNSTGSRPGSGPVRGRRYCPCRRGGAAANDCNDETATKELR